MFSIATVGRKWLWSAPLKAIAAWARSDLDRPLREAQEWDDREARGEDPDPSEPGGPAHTTW